MVAVTNGYTDVEEVLIDRGVNIQATNRSGKTALAIATKRVSEAIMQLLVEAKTISAPKSPSLASLFIISLDILQLLCIFLHSS